LRHFFGNTLRIKQKNVLIIEASRSHADTSQTVELLSTSDQPDPTLTRDIHSWPWRDSNPQS